MLQIVRTVIVHACIYDLNFIYIKIDWRPCSFQQCRNFLSLFDIFAQVLTKTDCFSDEKNVNILEFAAVVKFPHL